MCTQAVCGGPSCVADELLKENAPSPTTFVASAQLSAVKLPEEIISWQFASQVAEGPPVSHVSPAAVFNVPSPHSTAVQSPSQVAEAPPVSHVSPVSRTPLPHSGVRPTQTRRPDTSGPTDAPRVRAGGGRVTPPVASDRDPSRPTLERRSAAPGQGARPPSTTARPRSARPSRSPQADRPSTRRPDQPRAESPSRPSSRRSASPRPTERSRGSASPRRTERSKGSASPRRTERSKGSSSARPAPRARPRTPPADRGATRPAPRRPANTRAR